MRPLVVPETGEIVEVLPSDVVGVEPYDYAEAKRAVYQHSLERRRAQAELTSAINEKAKKERQYKATLASEILLAKAEYGATLARHMAEGTDRVGDALEAKLIAEGAVEVAKQRLQLASEDRASLHRLIEWSQMYDRFNHGGQ